MLDHNCPGPGCLDCQLERSGRIRKRSRKNIKNASKDQERKLGKRFQAAGFENSRRVPASGSISILPGDVESAWFLGEAKETREGRMTISPEWYDKIEAQAVLKGKPWWVLFTWVGNETGKFRKVVSISEDTFFELIRRLNAAESELQGITNNVPMGNRKPASIKS